MNCCRAEHLSVLQVALEDHALAEPLGERNNAAFRVSESSFVIADRDAVVGCDSGPETQVQSAS